MEYERYLLFLICLLLAASGAHAGEAPLAVSPGDVSKLVPIGDSCPTFGWSAVSGARSYELVVYRMGGDNVEAKPVLRETFPGSASSWTPSLDRCLERGGRYGWSVRALGEEESSWSPPSLFEVTPGPSRMEFEKAVAIVRQYFDEVGDGNAPRSEESAGALVGTPPAAVSPSARGTLTGEAPQSGVAGDSNLQVNDAAVVTTATLGAGVGSQLCLAVDYRYVDLVDGTVLDCSTGLLWLKDASCADLAGTSANGSATWATAQSAAAALADGTCGLTDGSSAGDWRQPTISELCSAWSGAGLQPCPANAAADSLIDSSVSGSPKVVNASGDARWSEGNAFVGVQSSAYWSATPSGVDLAWGVGLSDGAVGTDSKDLFHFVWPVRP